MVDDRPGEAGRLLATLLHSYRPSDSVEAADVARLAEFVRTAQDPWARSAMLHATGSALVVHPDSGQVLLRWHPRQQAWMQVGGHADADEDDPIGIALREAQEETGLTDLRPWPTPDLVHVVIVPVAAGNGEPAHEHADLRFLLATSAPDTIVAENSHAPLRWMPVGLAFAATSEANLQETLRRLQLVLPGENLEDS